MASQDTLVGDASVHPGGLPIGFPLHHADAQTLAHSASVSVVPGVSFVFTATEAPQRLGLHCPETGTSAVIRATGQPVSTNDKTSPARMLIRHSGLADGDTHCRFRS